ncbi:MAG TPA: zinc ribbon domain-containing protein [Pyrinomonadaceae bacterium]
MQPEISRRCLSCGAAGRAGARFCPQCGEQVPDSAAAAGQGAPAPETREVESPHVVAPTREVELPAAEAAREWTPPTREFAAFAQSFEGAGAGAAQADAGEPPAGAQPQAAGSPGLLERDAPLEGDAPRRAADSSSPDDASRSKVPQAYVVAGPSAAGAGGDAAAGDVRGRVARVREGTRARVEKMRDEAIVVLEETPDDSGLRFVLAAAALFGVFLLLLFLSTTVLR